MKTPQEWVAEFGGKPTIQTESMEGVYVTPTEITTIQQDAFESGRVYGLKLAAHQDRSTMSTDRNRDLIEQCAKEHELAAATPNPLKSPSL